MAKRAGRSRTRLLALEPRVLFDGALADTTAAVAKPVHLPDPLGAEAQAPSALDRSAVLPKESDARLTEVQRPGKSVV